MTFLLMVAAAMSVAPSANGAGGVIATPPATPVVETVAPERSVAATPAPTEALPAPVLPDPLVLPKGTLVRLMVTKEVNSRDAVAGTRFALRVDEEVKVGGVTIVPIGAKAWAEVVNASGTGGVGKGGKLNAKLLYVEARDQQIPLEGNRDAKGGSSTGQVVAGILSFGIGGLLMKGNNATLKAGEIFNGYTLSDSTFSRPGPNAAP